MTSKAESVLDYRYQNIIAADNQKDFFTNIYEYVKTLYTFPELKNIFETETRNCFTERNTEEDKSVMPKIESYFYDLFIFSKGYKEFNISSNYDEIEKKYQTDKDYQFNMKDITQIEKTAQGLHELFETKYGKYTDKYQLRYLAEKNFKNILNKVHGYILTKLPNSEMSIKAKEENTFDDEKWWKEGQKPSFKKDYEGGPVIMLGEKVCKIPDGTNLYILCEAIFSKPIGVPTKEIEVIDKFFRGDESKQGFYDAIRGVNKRIKTKFGIVKLLKYGASKAYIDAELFK